MKRIWIYVPDCAPPVFKRQIHSDTKVSDVLSSINLSDDYVFIYWHVPPGSDPTKTFTPDEVLYDLIENEQMLKAKLPPDVAAEYPNAFLP